MKNLSASFRVLIFSGIFLSVVFANAQNTIGYGPRAKSMAGAGTALVEHALWGNLNPGGLVFLGQKYGISLEGSIPTSSYQVIGEPSNFEQNADTPWPLGLHPGLVEAEKKTALMPQIGINILLDDNNSIGLSIYGNNNRGCTYNERTYHSSVIESFGSSEGFINPMGTVTSPTFLKLNQYFIALSYSRKLGEKWGLGFSAIGAWQSLNTAGLEAFGSLGYSANPDKLTNNESANSFGAGAKLGVQWMLSEKVQFGLAFRTKLVMSTFSSYQGLIAKNGSMDIPGEINFGMVYHPFERFLLALDVNRYCYSQVPAWGLAMQQNGGVSLGGEQGGGFGRKDQMSYKLGVQYKIPNWQFRAGYAHTDQPLVSSEVLLNLLIPDITTNFVSLGASRKLGKQTINFAIVRGLKNSFTGINILDQGQAIELQTDSWIMELAIEF
jgi:long-chain fatty acid transport protein